MLWDLKRSDLNSELLESDVFLDEIDRLDAKGITFDFADLDPKM